MAAETSEPKHRRLLISDLDGALLGDEEALARFARWYERCRHSVALVYASGRFYRSVVQCMRHSPLPEPTAVVGGVGTEIHDHPSGRPVTDWHEEIGRNWDAERVRRAVAGFDWLDLQPQKWQSDFKVSYYLYDAEQWQLDSLREALREHALNARIIYSSGRDLDILPAGANKGSAGAFLARRWHIPPERVLASGDSGNDRPLFEQGFKGIVVANAQPELKRVSGPRIYHARYGYAAGVLEGIEHWWNTDELEKEKR